MIEVWTVPFPKASFAKKKTSSKWSVFSAQHSLGNRLVLPGATVSHVNRTLSYLNAMFLQIFEVVEDYLSMQNTISMYLKNLISLTMSITNMNDY